MLARANNLPAIPDPGEAVAAAAVMRIENDAIAAIPHLSDISVGEEWLRRAAALERYLKSREMQGPVRGAQRRIEARIGQLLGPAENTGQLPVCHDIRVISRPDRHDFRLLARALDNECPLVMDEWRKSRRALVKLIRERLGLGPPEDESEIAPEDDFLSPSQADQSIRTIAQYLKGTLLDPPPGIRACLRDAIARASPEDVQVISSVADFLTEVRLARK